MNPIDTTNTYDPRNSSYFGTLPKFVQETIVQSSDVKSDEELKSVAENIIKEKLQ